MYELILISQSPRRKQLLEEAGYKFLQDSVKVSEIIEKNVNLDVALQHLAQTKIEAYLPGAKALESKKIIGLSGDTVVTLDEIVFGKPKSEEEAFEFLRYLSGKAHCVKTALALYSFFSKKLITTVDTTKVFFKVLSDQQIKDYIQTGEPMDKAGAWGIQGLGKQFVRKIEGSWSNVMGLPIDTFEKVILENGWNIIKK